MAHAYIKIFKDIQTIRVCDLFFGGDFLYSICKDVIIRSYGRKMLKGHLYNGVCSHKECVTYFTQRHSFCSAH